MNPWCTDRDLLVLEPMVFTSLSLPGQVVACGDAASCSGTTLTCVAADLIVAGVRPGMVLCLHGGTPSEGACCEIVSVDGPATLTVSRPRCEPDGPPEPLPPGEEPRAWRILTFAPQIAAAVEAVAQRLRTLEEAAGIAADAFVDSPQLRLATACRALETVYASAAAAADEGDARWTKAHYYGRRFHEELLRLRLAVDADGDGLAERTRTLANVRLRRL